MPERFCTIYEKYKFLSMGYISALTQASFLQSPGTQGQNMKPNRLSNNVEVYYCAMCKCNYWFF